MPHNVTYAHECEENDNMISLYVEYLEEGKEDVELHIHDNSDQGYLVVGLKDLQSLMDQAGYTIQKKVVEVTGPASRPRAQSGYAERVPDAPPAAPPRPVPHPRPADAMPPALSTESTHPPVSQKEEPPPHRPHTPQTPHNVETDTPQQRKR